MNNEFTVGASHKLALISSLPFKVFGLIRSGVSLAPMVPERLPNLIASESKSSNKVALGESAE